MSCRDTDRAAMDHPSHSLFQGGPQDVLRPLDIDPVIVAPGCLGIVEQGGDVEHGIRSGKRGRRESLSVTSPTARLRPADRLPWISHGTEQVLQPRHRLSAKWRVRLVPINPDAPVMAIFMFLLRDPGRRNRFFVKVFKIGNRRPDVVPRRLPAPCSARMISLRSIAEECGDPFRDRPRIADRDHESARIRSGSSRQVPRNPLSRSHVRMPLPPNAQWSVSLMDAQT